MTSFFDGIPTISYDPQADHDFAYRSYNPDEMLMGKTMAEHLRFAVAYWHSFAWEGGDPFGGQTFLRPWFDTTMDAALTWNCDGARWTFQQNDDQDLMVGCIVGF